MSLIRTQIQLTKEQATLLKKISREKHISIAEIIRRSLDPLIKNEIFHMREKRRKAQKAAGKFRSGLKDLSTRHDDYLSEAFIR